MYKEVIKDIRGKDVTLVAVSKTRSNEQIMGIYNQGQRIFGENRVQELVEKQENLPRDIEWHLIGHLQTNKVKYIAPFVEMIHSVDSAKLLREINAQAQKHDRVIKILLQCKIAREESKYGLAEQELMDILKFLKQTPMENIQVAGVMGMATFTDDEAVVSREFKNLKTIFDKVNQSGLTGEHFKVISMGMSGDYLLAVKEGSTMIRVGSLIFK